MAKVKCILGYYDTQLNRSVAIDEELTVADDRAKQLVKAKVAKEVTTPTTEKVVKKGRAKKEA
jgi:hypothetical protein